jgi:anti-sigma B factor antagonist
MGALSGNRQAEPPPDRRNGEIVVRSDDRSPRRLAPVIPVSEPTAPHFVVDTRRSGTVETVVVRGEVDIATSPLLRAVLDTVIGRRPTRVVVDLSGATFLDAHALSTLAAVRRRLANRRTALVLRDPSPAALRVLELAAMMPAFEIETGPADVRRAG